MGCQKSKPTGELQKKELIVGTLNYCGIMNNPFEFYCQDYQKELISISTIFESLLPEYFKDYNPETFKWSMGKIDVKVRVGRYSPFFSPDAGIQNQRFVTRDRFSQIWDQIFDDQEKKIGEKFTNQERESAKLYDFIFLHALLIFAFKTHTFTELIKQNTAVYRKKISPFFQLSFLDQKKKLDAFIKNFKQLQIDILCIQQYSKQLQKYIDESPEFIKVIDDTKDTMIIARKTSFRELKYIENVLTKEEIEGLNWAGRSSFLCLDNVIIINAHLTSKAAKNKPQIEYLQASLLKLRKNRPKYDIILAGDLNSFLAPTVELNSHFQMFPDNPQCTTTTKKRTMTQAQFNKGNKLVEEGKDKIMTSLKMKNCKVLHIDRTESKKGDLLPQGSHPFDHFLIVASIYK